MFTIFLLLLVGALSTASLVVIGPFGLLIAIGLAVFFGLLLPAGRSAMVNGDIVVTTAMAVTLVVAIVAAIGLTQQVTAADRDAFLAQIAGLSPPFAEAVGRASGCWEGAEPEPCPGFIRGQARSALAIVQTASFLAFCFFAPLGVWALKAGSVWRSVRQDGKPPSAFMITFAILLMVPLGIFCIYLALSAPNISEDASSARGLRALLPYVIHAASGHVLFFGTAMISVPGVVMARRSAWRQLQRAMNKRPMDGYR